MPRLPSKKAKIRLNLEIPTIVRARMEALRDLSGADTLTEVIRRSLAVYDALLRYSQKGATVVVRAADGTEQVLILPGEITAPPS